MESNTGGYFGSDSFTVKGCDYPQDIKIDTAGVPQEIEVKWPDVLKPFDTSCLTIGGGEYFDSTHNFVEFCKYVTVQHPLKGIIPFEVYEYHKQLVWMMEGSARYILGTKFRQGGFTTLLALYSLWKCLSSAGQNIGIVARSDYDARDIGCKVNGIIDRMPGYFKENIGTRGDYSVCFNNDSRLWFMTPTMLRGRALNYLIVDEAAFIEDWDKHWLACYPAISAGGKATILSTINRTGDWFHNVYMDAQNGKNQFSIYRCHSWQHPEYSQSAWQKEMRKQLGDEVYQREVEQQFVVKKPGYDFKLYDEMVMGVFRDLVEKRIGKRDGMLCIYGTDEKADACMFGLNEVKEDGTLIHKTKLPIMNLYCINYAFDSGLKVHYRLNIRTVNQEDMHEIINSILDRFKLHNSRPSRDIGVGDLLIDSIDTNLDASNYGELRVLKYGMNLRLLVR